MQQFLLRLVSNAIALYVAAYLVNGIQFAENGQVDVGSLVVVALTFGIVNAVIKPIVQIVTCPAYVITLGLFTFIVNAWMLILTERLTGRPVQCHLPGRRILARFLGGSDHQPRQLSPKHSHLRQRRQGKTLP